MRKPHRALAALSVLAVSAVAVSGCAPAALKNTGKPPVAIGIDANDPEQVVLGEIYSRVLQQLGRPTSLTATDFSARDTLRVLKETPIDFVVTCTGRLVKETDAAAAERLAKETKAGAEGISDTVYDAAVASLPGTVRTVDPSPAQGCSGSQGGGKGADAGERDEAADLPQNVIPLFSKAGFDRGEINRLNFITRVISTTALEEMVDEVESGARIEDALASWMMEYAHIDVYADELADPDEGDAASGDSADSDGSR